MVSPSASPSKKKKPQGRKTKKAAAAGMKSASAKAGRAAGGKPAARRKATPRKQRKIGLTRVAVRRKVSAREKFLAAAGVRKRKFIIKIKPATSLPTAPEAGAAVAKEKLPKKQAARTKVASAADAVPKRTVGQRSAKPATATSSKGKATAGKKPSASKIRPAEIARKRKKVAPAVKEAVAEGATIQTAPAPGSVEPATQKVVTGEITRTSEQKTEPRPYIDHGPMLPDSYGVNRIVALARDPSRVFAYWDIEKSVLGAPAKGWILRITEGGSVTYDIQIDPAARNWYIQSKEAQTYDVSIGYYGEDGVFNVVATARRVSTPRARPAPRRETQWVDVLAMTPGQPARIVSESPYASPSAEYLKYQAQMRESMPLGYGVSSARLPATTETKKS